MICASRTDCWKSCSWASLAIFNFAWIFNGWRTRGKSSSKSIRERKTKTNCNSFSDISAMDSISNHPRKNVDHRSSKRKSLREFDLLVCLIAIGHWNSNRSKVLWSPLTKFRDFRIEISHEKISIYFIQDFRIVFRFHEFPLIISCLRKTKSLFCQINAKLLWVEYVPK